MCEYCEKGRSGQIWMDQLNPEIWQRSYENTIGLLLREIEVVGDLDEQ